MGGRYFHAPFIVAAAGVELAGVVARAPERVAEVAHDLPGVPVFGSLGALLDSSVDAVTISTPPHTRRELVLEAVGRGINVVADKPFAPTAEGAQELIAEAARAGVLLSVFQNRRWDTDVTTLRTVLDAESLGDVWRFESRFELDEPQGLEAGPTGGLLRDLGSHLIDQALWLFGPASLVSANLDWCDLAQGRTDAGFVVTIAHVNGTHSHLSASKVNRLVAKELWVLGSQGSYVSRQTDVQTQAILTGKRPADNLAEWGFECPELWGELSTARGRVRVPSAQGAYFKFYEQFAAAVDGQGPQPVPAGEAIETIRVLDAARTSALERRTVAMYLDTE
jgi:predicted dehydrogenase